jgi:hypothetical protein
MPESHELIPLYDDTAPIACTIGAEEIPERIELLERMRTALISIERTSTGLLLRFPNTPPLRRDVECFAEDEKRCCQFWGFDVIDERECVGLRWDGPQLAERLLAKVETFFRTGAPISILDGLL